MKSWRLIFLGIVLVVSLGLLIYVSLTSYPMKGLTTDPAYPRYLNTSLPIDERVESLLDHMTLREKVAQMALVEKNSIGYDDVGLYGIGAVLSGAGAKPEQNTPDGWRHMVNAYIAASRGSRLGIPLLYGVDAIHGHANVPGATVFPHAIGLGAAHDELLVEDIARATALELGATNIFWTFSPNLDLPRDIRWGRTYETFSDDPALAAHLGAAYVRGTQNTTDAAPYPLVAATAKHFIGVGGMRWGSSSNENFKIDQGLTLADKDALRREYVVPFKAAVDAGVMSVMVGLNSWGDTKLAAERELITDLLKGELGFQGFVVSDWYGVYELSGTEYEAAVTAINAGVDMVMLPFEYVSFIENVTKAVEEGDIGEARIDDAVARILRVKFRLGLFDGRESPAPVEGIGSETHRALARAAVSKSLVLLKDANNVLPIQPEVRHIRIAGSAADNVGRQAGAWTVEWQGIDGNWLPGATSILKGIRDHSPDLRIEYDASGMFDAREKADLGIAIIGEVPYAEGWGDRDMPILDAADREAISRLRASSHKVLIIVVSGRPLLMTDEILAADAVVAAWLPGSEGAGVADVLFGDLPFTGTLPLPWPRTLEQLPISVSGETADGTEPLFTRGYSQPN